MQAKAAYLGCAASIAPRPEQCASRIWRSDSGRLFRRIPSLEHENQGVRREQRSEDRLHAQRRTLSQLYAQRRTSSRLCAQRRTSSRLCAKRRTSSRLQAKRQHILPAQRAERRGPRSVPAGSGEATAVAFSGGFLPLTMRIRESDGNSDRKIGCTRSGALQADCKRSGKHSLPCAASITPWPAQRASRIWRSDSARLFRRIPSLDHENQGIRREQRSEDRLHAQRRTSSGLQAKRQAHLALRSGKQLESRVAALNPKGE